MNKSATDKTDLILFFLSSVLARYESTADVRLMEYVRDLLESNRGQWSLEGRSKARDDKERSVTDMLAEIVGKGSVHRDRAEWVNLMVDEVQAQGVESLSESVWAITYEALLSHATAGQEGHTEAWRDLARPEWWAKPNGSAEWVVKDAFETNHVSVVEHAIEHGFDVKTLLTKSLDQRNNGYANGCHELLAWSPSEEMALLLLERGADPLCIHQGESVLGFIAKRSSTTFARSSMKEEVEDVVKEAMQKKLKEADSSTKNAVLFSTFAAKVQEAVDWRDVQAALKEIGPDLKETRGSEGQTPLQHLMKEKPYFLPGLMRTKHRNEAWWKAKDDFGQDISHYAIQSGGNARYGKLQEKVEDIQSLMRTSGCEAPETEQGWLDWHRVYWTGITKKWSKSNAESRMRSGNTFALFPLSGVEPWFWPKMSEKSKASKDQFEAKMKTWEGAELVSEQWLEFYKTPGTQRHWGNTSFVMGLPDREVNSAIVEIGLTDGIREVVEAINEYSTWKNEAPIEERKEYQDAFEKLSFWVQKNPQLWLSNEAHIDKNIESVFHEGIRKDDVGVMRNWSFCKQQLQKSLLMADVGVNEGRRQRVAL
jgi:hypothetical protein